MIMSDISLETIGLFFITVWDPTNYYIIIFSNEQGKISCDLYSQAHNNPLPLNPTPSAIFTLLNKLSEKKVSFNDSLLHPLVACKILFVQGDVPPISCWKYDVFIASFPYFISR